MSIVNNLINFIKKFFFEKVDKHIESRVELQMLNTHKPLIVDSNIIFPVTNEINPDSIPCIKKSTIQLLLDWEDKKYSVYTDVIGIPTIGIGHAIFDKEEQFDGVKLISSILTEEQISSLLAKDLVERLKVEREIKRKIKITLNQNQYDALVLLIFNKGSIPLELANVINENTNDPSHDEMIIRKHWRYYRTAKGTIFPGLINRREGEVDLFFSKYKGRNYYIKCKNINGKIINPYYSYTL